MGEDNKEPKIYFVNGVETKLVEIDSLKVETGEEIDDELLFEIKNPSASLSFQGTMSSEMYKVLCGDETFEMYEKAVNRVLNAVEIAFAYAAYPNSRVAHLAQYHKSERVRKKNMHRIMKWYGRTSHD